MSRDSSEIIISKDVAKKIAFFLESRNDFFSFSSVNRNLRRFFKENREQVLEQGKIIPGDNNSTFFLTFSGELFACGENYYRQLGVGDREKRIAWTKTGPPGKKVTRVISKPGNTFAFCEDGLYACGTNSWGQLGLGDDKIKEGWFKIGPVDKKILDVEATLDKIFLHCEDTWGSTWYAAGKNTWGELGTGDTKDRWEWVEIKVQGKVIVKLIAQKTHTLVGCAYQRVSPIGAKLEPIVWYGCGSNRNCELISQNRQNLVLEWVEIGPPNKNVLQLISTPHTIFVCCKSGWYARGGNGRGRLSYEMNDKTDPLDWIKLLNHGKQIIELCTSDTGESTFIRCKDGWYSRGLDPFYRDSYDDMDPDRWISEAEAIRQKDLPFWLPLKIRNKEIIEIKSSDGMNIFMRCEDGWYAYGENQQGQLGTGEDKKIHAWVKIGPEGKHIFKLFSNFTTFILCEDGWYGCGNNYCGQLGIGNRESLFQWTKLALPSLEAKQISPDEPEAEPLKITL